MTSSSSLHLARISVPRALLPRLSTAQNPVALTRPFSSTIAARKSTPDTVSETLKKADRTVSDQLVKGIDKGRKFFFSLYCLLLAHRIAVLCYGCYLPAVGELVEFW
jgi:hypothetical protein